MTTKKQTGGGSKQQNSAFMKPVYPSAALAKIVGNKPLPRTEVTKKVWEFIRANGCQDKVNKRMINPKGALADVLGTKQIDMFAMTKAISKHLHAKEPAAAH